jgi:hypothetical protein
MALATAASMSPPASRSSLNILMMLLSSEAVEPRREGPTAMVDVEMEGYSV